MSNNASPLGLLAALVIAAGLGAKGLAERDVAIQIGGAGGRGYDDGSSRIKRLRRVSSFHDTLK